MKNLNGEKLAGNYITRTFKLTMCTCKVYNIENDEIIDNLIVSVDGMSPDLRKELDKKFEKEYPSLKLLKVLETEVISNRYALKVEDFIKYAIPVMPLEQDENEQG